MQKTLLTLLLATASWVALAQQGTTPQMHAGEIQQAIKKLKTLGSVMYLAAHPDDENTGMIAYLTKGRHLRTAYLSLTRGDGGQNLLGKEVREELGLIRTQELLAARSVDGGLQYFTRANDFGYSKSASETLEIWDKKMVLADVVLAIRRFKPDVIITRFSPDPMNTHGHHTASAQLALEAFKAAGDPRMFPEQLAEVAVWKPRRMFWNTSPWFYRDTGFDPSGLLAMDIGGYNTLLGQSYGEIAARSRSMHKSQGFGAANERGQDIEYLQLLEGDPAELDIMEGIDTDWTRLPGGEEVEDLIDEIYHTFNIEKPERSVPDLLDLHRLIQNYLPSEWANIKIKELEQIILQCAGVWVEASVDRYAAAPGDTVRLMARMIRRVDIPVTLERIGFAGGQIDTTAELPFNTMREFEQVYVLPADAPISQPYWLRESPSQGMFTISDEAFELIGMPENPPALQTSFTFSMGLREPEKFTIKLPVNYRWVEPADGEKYRPFQVTPPVTVTLDQPVYVAFGQRQMQLNLRVRAHTADVRGMVMLRLDTGWQISGDSLAFDFAAPNAEQQFSIMLSPPVEPTEAMLTASVLTEAGEMPAHALTTIAYPHIPLQTIFPKTEARLVKLQISTMGQQVGYLPGAGDAIPDALEAVGYEVIMLDKSYQSADRLAELDAIVVGVRALNAHEDISNWIPVLMEYASEGGHVVMQYNTTRGLKTKAFAPYPIRLSRNRITREDAAITILEPDHLILQKPNRITQADFDGWVQERGLYFPEEWDEPYQAILSSHDPSEQDLKGGLLVCDVGEGSFIYTSYSWFRQLPAGVPGAFRMFVNLVSYGEAKRSANR